MQKEMETKFQTYYAVTAARAKSIFNAFTHSKPIYYIIIEYNKDKE